MPFPKLIFRLHAVQRMFDRGISEEDVRMVIDDGKVIENKPDDLPYPSCLLLGFPAGRPLHVVASDDIAGAAIIVVTVYDPDPKLWDKTFRKRRK